MLDSALRLPDTDVAIVGAGPVGLLLAILLSNTTFASLSLSGGPTSMIARAPLLWMQKSRGS